MMNMPLLLKPQRVSSASSRCFNSPLSSGVNVLNHGAITVGYSHNISRLSPMNKHHAHSHHAAQHDAKAEHRSKGAADEPQKGVFALFLWRLGAFGCLGCAGTVFRCGVYLAAALGNIDLTSHRAGRLFLAAPMDLSHLIVGDRDRLLTFQDCCRALLRRALSTSFVTRNFKLQYHIIARTPQPGKNQSLRAEQI